MKYVYILKSVSRPRRRYVGMTGDLTQRLEYHNNGRCSYTSKFMPWEIVYCESFESGVDAMKRERQIKGWSGAKKDALIEGDWRKLSLLGRRGR